MDYIQDDQDAQRKAKGQSKQINKRKQPFPCQVPERDLNEVLQHEVLSLHLE